MNPQHQNSSLLPPLSFEMDTADHQRLYTATELTNWGDYYTSSGPTGTLLGAPDSRDRPSDNNAPQYRPWESGDGGPPPPGTPKEVLLRTGFSGVIGSSQPSSDFQQPSSKLPSFQSQFNAFQDAGMTPEPSLTTLTPVPVSPNSSTSPSGLSTPHLTPLSTAPVSALTQITQLGPGPVAPAFHTLARGYPLVPAPVQAREVPSINQQYLDERHIQLYQPVFQPSGIVTVLKNEPAHFDLKSRQQENGYSSPHLITSIGPASSGGGAGDGRKKERRKARASSLESASSSHQSDDQVSSAVDNETHSGQVAAVSSTASFKSPLHHGGSSGGANTPGQGNGMGRMMDTDDVAGDKQVKKKRKRCGECVGCQRKDNCGDCAPCRNDKSHQICKQRRCEKLTEKKLIYGPDGNLIRQESRRGRGKGRGTGSYRGRKSAISHGLNTPLPSSLTTPPPPGSTLSPAPASHSPAPATTMKHDNSGQQHAQHALQQHGLQQQQQQQLHQQQQQHHIQNQQQQQQTLQQQQMAAPMAFYPATAWGVPQPTDQTQAWQNQFIQQLPTQDYHQTAYAATPLYQTNGYVQNVTFEAPTFYSAAQVQRSPSGRVNGTGSYPTIVGSNGTSLVRPDQTYQTSGLPNGQPTTTTTFISQTPATAEYCYQSANSDSSMISGNAQPGYPRADGTPRPDSRTCNGYPGEYGNTNPSTNNQTPNSAVNTNNDRQLPNNGYNTSDSNDTWQNSNNTPNTNEQREFSQADRVHLNTRIKSMILNKHGGGLTDDNNDKCDRSGVSNDDSDKHGVGNITNANDVSKNNNTDHFLSRSHHPHDLNSSAALEEKAFREDLDRFFPPASSTISALGNAPPAGAASARGGGDFRSVTGEFWTGAERLWNPYGSDNGNNTTNNLNVSYEVPKSFDEPYRFAGDGGPAALKDLAGYSCCRRGGTGRPTSEHLRDGACAGLRTEDEALAEPETTTNEQETETPGKNQQPTANPLLPPALPAAELPAATAVADKAKTGNNGRNEVPECDCFPTDKNPPEPGNYYTHLGAAGNLSELRSALECRAGLTGEQLRIEKVCYTGKEGKTSQGCPMAKWIIRRADANEKVLCIVKHRQGHKCATAYIVVCIVAWEGVPQQEADVAYSVLTHKLNKFGLPTTRRCATNESRTCACQGLNPDTCGASFSFGCSWSMYYNGCKYARSKTVRKFRLSVRGEENEVEERVHRLAATLGPLYRTLAPKAFENQCRFEGEAPDCRLGFPDETPGGGRPFSGVTACVDFCAHAHRDLHNMNDGCTVVASLTGPRMGSNLAGAHRVGQPRDEQLHVLPLYVMDSSDEHGSKEGQQRKVRAGAVEVLERYPCEVRVRTVPLQPCRRHGKKRKDEPDPGSTPHQDNNISARAPAASRGDTRKDPQTRAQVPPSTRTSGHQQQQNGAGYASSSLMDMASMVDNFTEAQLQSNQISSTVLDVPYSNYDNSHNMYNNSLYSHHSLMSGESTANYYLDSQKRGYYGSLDANPNQWSDYSNTFYPDSTTAILKAGNPVPDDTKIDLNESQTPSSYEERNARAAMKSSGSNQEIASDGYPKHEFAGPHKIESRDYIQEHHLLKPGTSEYSPYAQHSYGNYLGNHYPFGSHYGHMQYDNYSSNIDYYNNDKIKREEFLNNCYNPYAYQNYPLGPPDIYQNPSAGNWCYYPPFPMPCVPDAPKPEPIGEVTEVSENLECFKDSQMGGVAIALGHGSVLFECAKHEMHATTALKNPNRLNPARISLVFYQHRNLNRPKHGLVEWEEKMRLKKLGNAPTPAAGGTEPANNSNTVIDNAINAEMNKSFENNNPREMSGLDVKPDVSEVSENNKQLIVRAPTLTTMSWTTLFPMHPCMVTGPYQEGNVIN